MSDAKPKTIYGKISGACLAISLISITTSVMIYIGVTTATLLLVFAVSFVSGVGAMAVEMHITGELHDDTAEGVGQIDEWERENL